jgi:hypothetical protein
VNLHLVNKFAFTILVLLLVACTSARRTQSSVVKPVDANLKFKTAFSNRITYKSLIINNIEGEVKINGNQNSFSCTVKSVNDSLLVISVNSLLGIEVVRVFITNDSVLILDRTKREYAAVDFKNMIKKYSDFLSVSAIKDILIGNIVNEFSVLNFSPLQLGPEYCKFGSVSNATINGEKNELIVNYVLNTASMKPVEFTWKSGKLSFHVIYSDYKVSHEILFPGKISLEAGNKEMEIILEIAIGNIKEIENPNSNIFIPDGYKRKL